MRAALYQAAGTVVVDDVPDAGLAEPTDAVVRVLRSCVCGSDLWAYRGVIDRPAGSRLGHEFIGPPQTLPLEQVADGYAAMSARRSIKTMLT